MAFGSGRKIIVEFIGDAAKLRSGVKDGEAALQGFSGKAQAAGRIAGKALAGGLVAAGGAAVLATKAAAEDEAAQAQLAQQLKQAAGASDAQIASLEDWITAQGKATGITDDELRPALAKLATATGDVGEAQKLAALAMDVSAGTGKDLNAVTEALVRAQNGSIGGLSRLGIATKDAEGKTLSLTEVTQKMADKYKGAAAAAAETTAGKTKIMATQFGELQEQIGANLLPVMSKLAQVGLKVTNWISHNTTTVGVAIGVLGGLLAITTAVGYATKVWTVITGAASIAQGVFAAATGAGTAALEGNRIAMAAHAAVSKVAAAGQWLLNAALSANPIGIVVVAIAALVAGLVIAYKKSETFRNIVDSTFSLIGKVVPKVIGTVVGFVKDHWGLLVSLIGGPVGIVAVQVAKHFGTIKSVASAAADFVVGQAKKYGQFAQQVVDKVGDVVKFFRDLPGKVKGFLAGLPGDLKSIGGQIIDGLVNGIKSAAHKVEDAVQAIINKIPKKIRQLMGIASPSKVTYELGGYIGDGLAKGIASKESKADAAAKKLVDKLKDRLKDLKDQAAQLRDSVAGAFAGDLFSAQATDEVKDAEGNVTTPAMSAGQNFIASLTSKSGQLRQVAAAFKTLKSWGWSPRILAALFQSGNVGLILDLAADKTLATQGLGLYKDVTGLSQQLGGTVGKDVFGDQIDAVQDKIKDAAGKAKGTTNRTYNVTVNVPPTADPASVGREVVKTIRSFERVSGRQLLVSPA